jgi:hypothetical protein
MVPVNLGVGLLSASVSDRSLVVAALLGTLGGLGLLIMATSGAAFYFAGGITLFVGALSASLHAGGEWWGAVAGLKRISLTSYWRRFSSEPVQTSRRFYSRPLSALCVGWAEQHAGRSLQGGAPAQGLKNCWAAGIYNCKVFVEHDAKHLLPSELMQVLHS